MSRATWTDERLDDFARNVDRRFDEVDRRMEASFNRVDGELRDIRSEIRTMRTDIDARFDGLQRVMIQAAMTLSVSFLTVGGAIIATQF